MLPSAPFPEGGNEDGQKGDGLQPAEEHGQAHDDFGKVRKGCVGAGGAELSEGRTGVAHGGEGNAQGIHEIQAVEHHGPGPEGGEGHVNEEERQYLEHRIPGELFLPYGHMENGPGVHMKFQNAGEAFEEKNEADHLQPAGSGTAAAAYDDEEKYDEFGKGRPLVKVRRHETGGGGQGGSLEQGFPQRLGKRQGLLQHQGGSHQKGGQSHDEKVYPKFRILVNHAEAPFPGAHIDAEIGTGNHHEEHHDQFQRRAPVVGHAFIAGGKTAGGNGGKGVVQGLQETHAPEHVGGGGGGGEAEVHAEESQRRFLDAGKRFGGGGASTFRIHHFGAAPSGLGKEGHKDDHDAQSAQPVGHGPEEEDGRRQRRKVIYHRGSRAGETGHAFHQPVKGRKGAGKDVGNGVEQRDGQPGKGCNGRAFPGREAHIGGNVLLPQHQGKHKGQQGGNEEGQHRAAVVEGQQERQKKHGAGAQNDAAQHGLDDLPVHTNPCL